MTQRKRSHKSNSKKKIYKILSLDGGGVRGLLTAILIKRILEIDPGFLESIDLFAGTSTGGLLALGLAHGSSIDTLIDLYKDHSEEIFKANLLRRAETADGFIFARYKNKALKENIENLLGKKTKLDDLKKHVLISSFDLNVRTNVGQKKPRHNFAPKFFHNFKGPDSDGHELALNVALRTSAAPGFFPSYDGFIDGGVVANNPSMAALSQALDPQRGKHALSNIHILSIGTGQNPTFIKGKKHAWGFIPWAPHLLNILIDGVMGVADFQVRSLLRGHYFRLNPLLPAEGVALDDTDSVEKLEQIGAKAKLVDDLNRDLSKWIVNWA